MKKLTILSMVMVFTLVLAACGNDQPSGDPAETTKVAMNEASTEEMTFTLEDLAQYNGKDGNKAYVAVEGVVYDVTGIPAWTGGEHNGNMAGQDVTEAIAKAPHGDSKLDGLEVVGSLVE
jgi:predicted heme/steroid binding protein